MIGVKIVAFMHIFSIMWFLVMDDYLHKRPKKLREITMLNKTSWYMKVFSWMCIIDIIGFIYFIIYVMRGGTIEI